ncbi:MAG: bifunctional DNA-formamidopyrimidine glycosylase/DNA-(apurinic or apyrimidinic site) lyase [Thermoleophilia bacterium]
MPELPEVETVRRGLLEALPGRRIESVETVDTLMLRTAPADAAASADELSSLLQGRVVEDVRRHGKLIFLVLTGDLVLSLHLGMTGQVILQDEERPGDEAGPRSHIRFVFRFSDEAGDDFALVFRDVRRFGRVEIGRGKIPERVRSMGPDALEGAWTSDDLARMLSGRRTPIKAFLLDQSRLAGIGNIYADEILFAAQISPRREAGSLNEDEIVRLSGEIRSRLAEGVRLKGCSISDFVDARGRPGAFQEVLQAYGRYGEKCPRCGAVLERSRVAGRTTTHCPMCQI